MPLKGDHLADQETIPFLEKNELFDINVRVTSKLVSYILNILRLEMNRRKSEAMLIHLFPVRAIQ